MFYCYILQSIKNNKYYIGSTENLLKRLEKHNSGLAKSTKPYVPWQLVYYEEYNTNEEAINREQQIKSWKKRAIIEKLINDFKINNSFLGP